SRSPAADGTDDRHDRARHGRCLRPRNCSCGRVLARRRQEAHEQHAWHPNSGHTVAFGCDVEPRRTVLTSTGVTVKQVGECMLRDVETVAESSGLILRIRDHEWTADEDSPHIAPFSY